MANLYGVANPLPIANYGFLIGGADIVCSAGAETNVVQWPNTAGISQGVYYPIVIPALYISLGATPPTSIGINGRINNGADVVNIGVNNTEFAANVTFIFSVPLLFPASPTLYAPPGVTIQMSVNPTGQNVTVRYNGSYNSLLLMRAPDQ